MIDSQTQSLIARIYEAALEPERWHLLLPQLLAALGCHRGQFGLATDGEPGVRVVASVELDPERIQRWQEEFASLDPWLEAFDRRVLPTGTAYRPFDLIDPDRVRRTDVYRAIFGPGGVDDHLATILSHQARDASFFCAYRAPWEEGFTADECGLHRDLSVHLTLAARIHDRLHALTRAREASEAVLARLPFGLVWLDEAGRILAMNPAAEAILRRRDGLRAARSRIEAADPSAQRALAAAIASALAVTSGRDAGAASLLRIDRTTLEPAYAVLVAPVPRRSDELVFGFEPRPVAVAIAVSDPSASPPLAEDVVRRLFGLTPALARLALALAHGRTLAEHAEQAGVTLGTARQQMKELLARMGARRQADVVRMILSSVAQIGS